MKKITKILLSLILVCCSFCFAACSSDPKEPEKYTVTLKSEVSPYDIDGVVNSGDFLEYNGIWATIEVEAGKVIGEVEVNTTVAEQLGYKFYGWYSDESYTLAWNLMLYPVNGNITLYAKWEKTK